jgi:hypothetical protein
MSNQNDHHDNQNNRSTNEDTNPTANFSSNSKDDKGEREESVVPSRKPSFRDKIMNKVNPSSQSDSQLSEPERISNNVTKIIISLFVLVGFIVLVTAIFVAIIGEGPNDSGQQAQILGNVFIAAIVGGFTIVGTIIYQVRGR